MTFDKHVNFNTCPTLRKDNSKSDFNTHHIQRPHIATLESAQGLDKLKIAPII